MWGGVCVCVCVCVWLTELISSYINLKAASSARRDSPCQFLKGKVKRTPSEDLLG